MLGRRSAARVPGSGRPLSWWRPSSTHRGRVQGSCPGPSWSTGCSPPSHGRSVWSPRPGYGKTTLLAQWAQRNQRRVAWISVDHHDNDPAVLLTYLAAALDRIEPIDPDVLPPLSLPGVVAATVVPRLAAEVSSMTEPVWLVLDHVELLEQPGVPGRGGRARRPAARRGRAWRSPPGAAAAADAVAERPGHGGGGGGAGHGQERGPAAAGGGRGRAARRRRRRARRADRGLAGRPVPGRAGLAGRRATALSRVGVHRPGPVPGRLPPLRAARLVCHRSWCRS